MNDQQFNNTIKTVQLITGIFFSIIIIGLTIYGVTSGGFNNM